MNRYINYYLKMTEILNSFLLPDITNIITSYLPGKIKNFSELIDLKCINEIEDWSEYIEKLNKGNPNFDADNFNSDFTCYVCYHGFKNHIDKFGNKAPFSLTFRYKPHKSNWRDEKVCTACFYALQNPEFKYFSTTIYGYPGILTKCKSIDGWFYKDTREYLEDEMENPDW